MLLKGGAGGHGGRKSVGFPRPPDLCGETRQGVKGKNTFVWFESLILLQQLLQTGAIKAAAADPHKLHTK